MNLPRSIVKQQISFPATARRSQADSLTAAGAGFTRTFIALVSIPLGLLLAAALMPGDIQAAGALVGPALILAFGLLTPATVDMLSGGLSRMFRPEHWVIIAVIYFLLLDLIEGLYDVRLEEPVIQEAFAAIALFALAVQIGATFEPRPLPRIVREIASANYSPRTLMIMLIVCFLLGMFNFAVWSDFSLATMIDGLLQPRFSAPWARGNLGGWNAFSDFLEYCGYILPTLTVMLAIAKRKWTHWSVLFAALLSIIFLIFVIQGGGRRIAGVMLGAAGLTMLLQNRHRLKRRYIAACALIGLCTILLMDVIISNRNEGFRNFSYQGLHAIRVDDNFLRLGQVMYFVPDAHPYVGSKWLLYLLVRPVPRVFWPEKPVDGGFSLPELLHEKNITLSYSAIGEWYVAFGWIGVAVGGLAVGVLARWWSQLLDHKLSTTSVALYAIGLMAIFLSIRSATELVVMTYPILCWVAIHHLVVPRRTPALVLRRPLLRRSR
jgi:oligosaccharide repeat unit polymerase